MPRQSCSALLTTQGTNHTCASCGLGAFMSVLEQIMKVSLDSECKREQQCRRPSCPELLNFATVQVNWELNWNEMNWIVNCLKNNFSSRKSSLFETSSTCPGLCTTQLLAEYSVNMVDWKYRSFLSLEVWRWHNLPATKLVPGTQWVLESMSWNRCFFSSIQFRAFVFELTFKILCLDPTVRVKFRKCLITMVYERFVSLWGNWGDGNC